jgi:hypothetical protein
MSRLVTTHLMRLDVFLERPGVFSDRPWTIVVTESNLGLVTTFRMSWWPVPNVSCAGGLPRSECSALAGTQEYLRDARIRADWQRGFINNFANQVGDGCDVTNFVTGTINDLATNLFTSNSDGVKSILNCLRTQLLQYRSFSSEALGRNNAFSSKRLAFSGKCGADGRVVNTMQDDLCIALQICMFASALVAQRRTTFFPHDTIST